MVAGNLPAAMVAAEGSSAWRGRGTEGEEEGEEDGEVSLLTLSLLGSSPEKGAVGGGVAVLGAAAGKRTE